MLTTQELELLKAGKPNTSNGNINATSIGASDFLNQVIAKRNPVQTTNNAFGGSQPGEKSLFAAKGPIGSFLSSITQSEQNLGKDIGRGILGGDKFVSNITDQYTKNADTLTQLAAKQTDPALKQKYGDMAKSMLEDGQKAGLDLKGRTPEQIIGDVLGTALDVGTTLTGLGAAKGVIAGSKTLSLGEKVAKGAITGAKTGAKYGAAYGTVGGLQEGKNIGGVVGSTVTGGLVGAATGGVIGGAVPLIKPALNAIKEAPGNIMRGVELKTKSIQEIAATKAKDVGKLNIREQAKWSSLQTKGVTTTEKKSIKTLQETSKNSLGGIENTAKISTEKITKQFDADIANIDKITKETNSKLSQSSIDTVIKERAPMRKLITEQGTTYAKLYKADVEPVKNVLLNKEDVIARIKSKLHGNIDLTQKGLADNIINALKFDKNGNVKLGNLNKQIKALKGGVSTQQQVNVNHALSGIGELMEEKGADFSKSNTFWKKWVPVKEGIEQKFDPFNFSTTNTSKGAKFIEDTASGKVDEAYLMNEITTRLGREITPQEKTLVHNMDLFGNNAKMKKIKYDLDIGKIEADRLIKETIEKAETEVATGKITEKALEKIRKVESVKWDNRIKAVIRKFITAAGLYAGIKGFEKATKIDIPII